MIGIISIDGTSPDNLESMAGLLLPDNLAEASDWSFVARPMQPSSPPPSAPQSGADVQERILVIRKHLREGLEYLQVQQKGLHEAIAAVEGIGHLVNRRDKGLFPRVPESQLQEEFEILRVQLEGIRQRTFFKKPLYGNGATPALRIHTSLWDTPRFEEVSAADLESLSLRLIYWGRVAGEGVQAPIHAKTVEDALRHLFEAALMNQSGQERLRNVFKSLSEALPAPSTDPSSTEAVEVSQCMDGNGEVSVEETDAQCSRDVLARLRAWFQQLLPGGPAEKCKDKNFHHNQDAAS